MFIQLNAYITETIDNAKKLRDKIGNKNQPETVAGAIQEGRTSFSENENHMKEIKKEL